jgi:hypothetical protein
MRAPASGLTVRDNDPYSYRYPQGTATSVRDSL